MDGQVVENTHQESKKTAEEYPPKLNDEPLDFQAKILQQPTQGRMSGLALSSSKRMLDPPLVIQLDIFDIKTESKLQSTVNTRFFCNVALYHATEDEQLGFAKFAADESEIYYNNLLGLSCRNCTSFDTMDPARRFLFVFPDLAIRLHGAYRLFCTVIDISSGKAISLLSNPFEVYSAQNFPGSLEPTQLSKWLYFQGISLRAGLHSRRSLAPRQKSLIEGGSEEIEEEEHPFSDV